MSCGPEFSANSFAHSLFVQHCRHTHRTFETAMTNASLVPVQTVVVPVQTVVVPVETVVVSVLTVVVPVLVLVLVVQVLTVVAKADVAAKAFC